MKPHKPRTWLATVLLVVVMVHNVVSTVNRFDPDMSDKKILDELLSKRRYDKRLRPGGGGVGGGGVTIVNVSVVVLSLSSPDESSLKYEVEFLIHQHWQDPRLAFDDEGRYEYLNGIHHQDDMWVPDTYFVKHGDFKQLLLPANIALRIFKDGVVKYTMRRRLSLSCEGNLNIFPFDDPKCSFAMESVSYEAHELVYRWKEDDNPPLHFLPSMHTLNAYIISNSTSRCDERLAWRGNYSCLKVHLTFTRDKSFYFSTVFIPGMLLVTSAFITFWLEWNAVPGRVMLGVTTMLNFFTTSNNFRSNLPVVSNLTAMNVWDGVCMCFIYASLLEFVAVNYLGRKKPRGLRCYRPTPTTLAVRPQSVQQSKSDQLGNHDGFSSCGSCPPGACTHVTSRCLAPASSGSPPPSGVTTAVHDAQQMKVPYLDLAHPLRVAKTIDVVSRVVFPVAYGVFLIFFFVRYNGFS